tara:strand:- start:262 stop:396 length:135 start_codon:yes stop_codon:yes gene_type:complete
MKLRHLEYEELIKKVDDNIGKMDYNYIRDLEEVYEIWTWHPGMG